MKRKFFIWFVAIIVVVVALAFFWDSISLRLRQGRVERLAEEFKRIEREDYERALADTYGGKTPQETLRLYIEAVEKGDYELASKYFVEDKQNEGRSMLMVAGEKGNIDFLLENVIGASESEGYFSTDGEIYTVEQPIFLELIKYPNGIWKILEV